MMLLEQPWLRKSGLGLCMQHILLCIAVEMIRASSLIIIFAVG